MLCHGMGWKRTWDRSNLLLRLRRRREVIRVELFLGSFFKVFSPGNGMRENSIVVLETMARLCYMFLQV